MEIGGLQKFSLLDYPGHLAAIIFTPGCNFRCQFCYNPMLVWPVWQDKLKHTTLSKPDEERKGRPKLMAEDDLFVFLRKRAGKLDGIVVSGGEPTIHPELPEIINKIKKLGYSIKLDTNGTNPAMLKELVERKLIDYLAMDIKCAPERYHEVTGVAQDVEKIKKSIAVIMGSGLPYEFRTTLVPGLTGPEDIAGIGRLIRGAGQWFLQHFESNTTLINAKLEQAKPYTENEMAEMQTAGAEYVKACRCR